jgi:uncharacterized iron-regulated membrane protein
MTVLGTQNLARGSKAVASGRGRRIAILVHRYVGLVMTVFLVVAGLTGSLLAFNRELDTALNPELFKVEAPKPGARLLDPFELQARVQEQLPPSQPYRNVNFDAKPNESLSAWLEVGEDKWRQFFVDPYTGALLGSRDWGNLSDGVTKNLMPFVYRLHYSLALGDLGTLLLGIVALLWTVDCFVGAYLTFPAPLRRDGRNQRSWLRRWLPAWQLRTTRLFSFVFTWHRASGLWIWAILLVFAWSAVGLNLHDVYRPVMQALSGFEQRAHDRLPHLNKPYPEPRLSLVDAHRVGRRLMSEQAERRGFAIERELWLRHHPDHGAFSYGVESSLDISSEYPRTEVYFDAGDGRPLGFEAATGISAGNTITSWLYGLHFAAVWGLWYRLFVCVMGVAVAALSVTGVWIWLRKRVKSRAKAPEAASTRVAGRIFERLRDARTDPETTGESSRGVSA